MADSVPTDRDRSGGVVVDPSHQMPEELSFRALAGIPAWLTAGLTIIAIALVINQLLNLQLLVGVTILENQYLTLLAAAFLPIAFLSYPARPVRMGDAVPWYDWALAAIAFAICGYLTWTGKLSLNEGWEYAAPDHAKWLSVVLWLVVIEALRRTGGWPIAIIVFFVSLYPTVAEAMPVGIRGKGLAFLDAMAFHMFSVESVFGIPMRAFGQIVVGFIVFGVALNHTGGGKFFNDLAFALVGRYRGGAAQVGVLSSMLQGSISGSVISNVVSSGVVTIPAMKRTGFQPAYAGGVEAVASTGAVLMPPVMGSTAFVMASFLGIPYTQIALAAAVPGLLFYFGLAIQIDAYAARRRLGGVAPSELVSAAATLRTGWPYIAVFAALIYFMVVDSDEGMAPFWATGLLLVVNQVLPSRMSWRQFGTFVVATGRALAELVAILAGVGFIIGAFTGTGLAGTLVNDLVFWAGNDTLVLLFMGALTSFIFGMGMTVTACYIFLAVVLAPALIKAGLDPLAVHLFIMYWGMVSFITPPVALAAFAAASIARTSPFAVGLQSIRLGTVIYAVPFLFVLEPALILRGQPLDIVLTIGSAFIGVFFLASGLQGYVMGGGVLPVTAHGLLARLLLLIGGVASAMPHTQVLGIGAIELAALGWALGLTAIALARFGRAAG